MELTWVAIAASLAMGLGAALIFVFAVRRGWFRDLEDAKYQVFWSDLPKAKDTKDTKEPPREDADARKPETN